jgi:hypothetical protein
MSKNSYVLINPCIEGKFKKSTKTKNSAEAAQFFYKNLSEHFNNAVPKFHFTIQKGGSGTGKMYHFEVKEQRSKQEVTFTINPFTVQGGNIDKFNERLSTFKNKFAQAGGKHHKKHHKKSKNDDSDSESSSSSSDVYKVARSYTPVLNQPFYYWWYDPYVYNLDSFWIPTFYSYVTPYIEIALY